MLSKKILVGLLFLCLIAVALPVFAASNSSPEAIQCVRAAVAVRETALRAALSDYTGAVNVAYTERAVALQSAYSLSSDKAIKTEVKSVWTKFNTFIKSVKNKWSMSKNEAWSNFRSAIKACKASSATIDSTSSSAEI